MERRKPRGVSHGISDQRRALLEGQLGFAIPPFRLPYEDFGTDSRIGVAGLHWVVQILHLPAYLAARFDVTAVAEIREEAIRDARRLHLIDADTPVVGDYRELVGRDDVDVIDSCFGHKPGRQERKLDLVRAAVSAGKPVLVHKPAASTLGVAEAMVTASEESGVPVCVNQNMRYNPAAYTMKQLLTPERMGPPLIIELQHYWRGDPKPADDRRPGVMQHVIHHADLIRWWVGAPCVSVYAKCQQHASMTIYTFANGTVAYHMENHSGVLHHDNTIRIQTANGIIHGKCNWDWHLGSSEGRDCVEVYRDTREPGVELPLPLLTYEPHWSEINKWQPHEGPWYDIGAPVAGMMGSMGSLMRGLSERVQPDNHISTGVESLRMALAVEIAAREGRPVAPDDVPSDYTTITEPPA